MYSLLRTNVSSSRQNLVNDLTNLGIVESELNNAKKQIEVLQTEKNKSLVFTSNGDSLILEKSIFFGKNQMINNFCMTISGTLNNCENKNITWELKKNN